MPNAIDFLWNRDCAELKNNFSKNVFHDHTKIFIKSSFKNKKKILWGHSEAQWGVGTADFPNFWENHEIDPLHTAPRQ